MPSSAPLLSRVGLLLSRIGADLAKKGVFGFPEDLRGLNTTGVSISNMRLSTDSLYLIWRNHADVFACVRELSQNVLLEGYFWENAKDSGKEVNLESVRIVEGILNYNESFQSIKNQIIQHQSISGNSYILVQKSAGSRKPIGIQVMDPRTLSVITNKYGTIKKWVQRVGADTQEFEPEEIVQWKVYKDPNSPVFGLSPLEPIVWEVRTDLAAMVSNYAFFVNDAQPAAQYILDDGLADGEADKAIKMLQEQLKGAENRHKSLVLQGVKEIKQLSISQKDMEFHVLRRFTTEKICATYGVPKSVLNYTDEVNYSNGENQMRKFWEGTITPLQNDFAQLINRSLLPALGISDIVFKPKERKFDTREYIENSSRADLERGILTINEVREIRGKEKFDPVEHGEFVDKPILYQGAGAVPVTDVGVDPEEIDSFVSPEDTSSAAEKVVRLSKMYSYGKPGNRKGSR